MRCDSIIELYEDLIGGVEKIKKAPEVARKSVAVALITSVFFRGRTTAAMFGMVVLAICRGVGEIVFVAFGTSRTFLHSSYFFVAKTIYVFADLRDKYDMNDNILTRK